jgi:hypothetical protein
VLFLSFIFLSFLVGGGEGRCGGQGRLAAETAGCRRVSIQVVEGGEKYAEQDLMVCGKSSYIGAVPVRGEGSHGLW